MDLKKIFTLKNIIFLTVLFLFLLLLRWNSFEMPFERDEGEYAYSAWILRQGIMPYENSFLQKPPMIIYTYAFGQLFDKTGIVSPRVLATIFSFLAICLAGFVSKRYFGTKGLWVTVFILTPMIMIPVNAPFAANTEMFMILPMYAALAVYSYKKDSKGYLPWLAVGVLSAVSFMYKQNSIVFLGMLILVWVYELYQDKVRPILLVRNILALFLGFIVTIVVILLPFIFSGKLYYVWEAAFKYNQYYVALWGIGLGALKFRMLQMFKYVWFLLILSLYFIFKKSKQKKIFTLFFFSIFISIFQSWLGHYYIMLMPIWALIITQAIILLSEERIVKKLIKHDQILWITVFTLLSLLYPVREQFGKTPEELNLWIYGRLNPFIEAQIAGQKLAEMTDPSERVYVLGSEPEILFYAKRRSSSRFINLFPVILKTPIRSFYEQEAIASLRENPPSAIVIAKGFPSGLGIEQESIELEKYVSDQLAKDYRILGGYVLGYSGGYWLNNITEDQIVNASLLLYKRI